MLKYEVLVIIKNQNYISIEENLWVMNKHKFINKNI